MRILLAAAASYAPPRGGATRSNLVWMNGLARAGHQCRVVCGPASAAFGAAEFPLHESIRLLPVAEPARRAEALRREIHEFRPDWVLVSSEDLSHGLLREAHRQAPDRVVYLAHTPQFFPFGPASWNPDPQAARLMAQSAAVVVIGHHMAEYIERALERAVVVIHPPIYGAGPFPQAAGGVHALVTMINPCAVKGLSLFLEAAVRLPRCQFGALPGWGTTAQDRRALERLPNVRLLPNAPGIDTVLGQVRVLLMPSLWYEGFGLIVMEAMLRGIPVVASDSGGLVEAKCGTGYVIPVALIERYLADFDEHAMPRPVVPANDPAPWVDAICTLMEDDAAWRRESETSQAAARRFTENLDAGAMERFLLGLARCGGAGSAADGPGEQPRTIESLSPEKRALLLDRLRQRRAGG